MIVNMRNKMVGKSAGKSDSARYYASNPEARRKKLEYDANYHSSEERIAYRVRLNKANRRMGRKCDGMDVSHRRDGGLVLERASSNRARNGEGGRRLL
jgi:hypothetical protein